ncbi:type II toxin-antitoxin system MqsA family antitoxin [Desulfovibrio sp. OttesenSCG-928-F20]|nr:type II toxin-antitoxin system MqsA family antitoxin [Desulfovibrio sp. OttesenSCG-928-F20]
MKCPVCGVAELENATKDLPYTYKGETIIVENVTGRYCSVCDDMILGPDESERFSNAAMELNKRVNASIIDPKLIRTIRKKLHLNQKQASKIFGGGPNAFSRYETGKALPPHSLMQLLRLLDKHPDLLQDIVNPGEEQDKQFAYA